MEGFTFYGKPGTVFGSAILDYLPTFVADVGVKSELYVSGLSLRKETSTGEYYDLESNHTYSPADPVFGGAYILRLRNGVELAINAQTGDMAAITDRNGNELTFTGMGIEHSSGRGIQFERDYAGRITAIIDPAGGRLEYAYDHNGNLVSFTDRRGGVTQYTYLKGEDAPEHYLDQIIDPLGRQAARSVYDEQGRLVTLIDAQGKTIQFAYDVEGKTKTITDQLGHVTTQYLDADGNVLREVDPLGGTVVCTFGDDHLLLTETIVIGLEDSVSGETNDLTTTYVYNAAGDLIETIDPRGLSSRTTYNEYGQPLTQTDTLGNTTTTFYNDRGLPTAIRDTNDNVTSLDFDSRGNLTKIKNSSGNTLVTNTYNQYGEILSTTPLTGRTTFFAYDENGDQTASWFFEEIDGDVVKILTETAYDENRNVTGTTQTRLTNPGEDQTVDFLWTTSTEYDANGQIIRSTDQFGSATENLYDTRGRLIESRNITRHPDGSTAVLLSRTVYDAAGRAVVTTNTYQEGTNEPITGSRTTYDAAGRVTQTESLTGVEIVITIDGNPNDFVSAVATVGTVFAARGTTFDSAGRVTSSTDMYGNVSETIYNNAGEVIQTRSETKDETGDPAFLLSRTVYDEYGRAEVTTDRFIENGSDPVLGTRTIYDDKGRVVRSERLSGIEIDIVDGETVLTAPGTVLYRTQTVYDSKGRVAKNIAADGQVTTYEYDSLNRRIATILHAVDPASVGLTPPAGATQVALRTETVYDDQGRVATERTNIAHYYNSTYATIEVDDSAVKETSYEYDIYGQVVKTTFADETFITTTYDDMGRVVAETNQLGLTRTFEYDEQGRLVAVELPAVTDPQNGNILVRPRYEYEFDAMGNQTLIRDPLGSETQFTFDARGNQLSRTLPLGVGTEDDFVERFEYDIFGRQVLARTFEGKVIRFVYDEGDEFEKGTGRLLRKEFFDNQTAYDNDDPAEMVEYTYDAFGRLVAVSDERGETTYTYDAQGNLTRTVSPEGAINYEYDALGRKTRTFTGDGDPEEPVNDFEYEYDALGRLSKVTVVERNDVPLTTSEQTAYAYDLQGNLDLQVNPNGVITDYSYDDLNRLTDLVHYLPDDTPETLADNDKLAQFEYTVREDGKRTQAIETFWFDSAVHENNITWTYDDAGRLIDEVFDHYDDDFDQTQHFTYDLVGNRMLRTVDEGNDTSIDQVFASLYDANDRLITEEADIDGDTDFDQTTTYGYTGTQQTSKTVTASSQTTSTTDYEYNLDGRLKTVTITGYTSGSPSRVEKTTYGYDYTGIRVSTFFEVDADVNETFEDRTRTTYLIDHHNFTGYQQVLEATVTNVVTSDLIKKVVYTIGHDQIAQTTFTPAGDPEGETLVFHTDGHSSTRVVTDLVATVLQIYAYDAFGVTLGFEEAQALTEYLYNNEQFDHRVALQYLRRRFYDAAIGRFPQLDEFFGNAQDPQSFHKYTFTSGDPVQFNDPTGMFEGLIGLVGSMGDSMNARMQSAGPQVQTLNSVSNTLKMISQAYSKVSKVWDWVNAGLEMLDLINFNPRDLFRMRNVIAGQLGISPGTAIPTGLNTKFRISLPSSIINKLRKVLRGTTENDLVQSWIGTLGSVLVAKALGFESTSIGSSYHGIDAILKDPVLGRFTILEAKGGSSKLASGQMYDPWIKDRLRKIRDKNFGTSDYNDFNNAVQGTGFSPPTERMWAIVVRLDIRKGQNDLYVGMQEYPGVNPWGSYFQ